MFDCQLNFIIFLQILLVYLIDLEYNVVCYGNVKYVYFKYKELLSLMDDREKVLEGDNEVVYKSRKKFWGYEKEKKKL